MFKFKYVALVIALVSILVAPSFAEQIKVYDNTANLSSESYATGYSQCYGDYIHLSSAAIITGIDLGYYCPEDAPGGGSIIFNTSLTDNSGGQWYNFVLTPGNNGIVHFDLTTDNNGNAYNYTLSQDLYIRIALSTEGSGILTADSTIGSADDTVYQTNWGSPPAYCGFRSPATLDGRHMAIALYTTPVPEPGTFAVLGSGLVGLLAFRRRRK